VRILVLGSNGLIGSTILRVLAKDSHLQVRGTIRSGHLKKLFPDELANLLVSDVDLLNTDSLLRVMEAEKPEVVINAAGLTKHLSGSGDPLRALPMNALLPHRLVELCGLMNARLVHISTDCVFKGDKGMYTELDIPDASDLYGRSKALGEVDTQGHVTIRTSTIGHELNTAYGLLNWFLAQGDTCKGYKKAMFSGLPTVELAEVIRNYVIPNKSLFGLYNVAADVVNKYELLHLIADVYGKSIHIAIDETVVIDRSLDGSKFNKATGYKSPDWPELIRKLYASR
jgi:dTDP-4-dehydrorhamnose reductase